MEKSGIILITPKSYNYRLLPRYEAYFIIVANDRLRTRKLNKLTKPKSALRKEKITAINTRNAKRMRKDRKENVEKATFLKVQ